MNKLRLFFHKKYVFSALLLIVVFIALVIRLWNLGDVPPSPDWDEAALGYNAYSILHTGKDEYGKTLPLILRSFDDYKPGLYAYFIIPLLPLLGLTLFAVRLPSVIFGVLTVLATYFLIKEAFDYNRDTGNGSSPKIIGLLAAAVLAISPWHIQFSRIAFEANVGVAFNVFAAFAFIKGLKNPVFLILSAVLMGLNLYIYQSEKVFMPLLFLILIFTFRNELLKIPKKIMITTLITGLIISLPMVIFTLTNTEGLARAKGVSVFSDQTQFLQTNAARLIRDQQNNDFLGLVLDNRRTAYVKAVISGYVAHFDLNWLFITADLPRHHAPFMGLLYLWELPFIFMGMYYLLFGPFPKQAKYLFILWFLVVPIPASITSGVPHSIRTLNYLPIYPLLTSLGLVLAFSLLKKTRPNFIKAPLFLGFFIFVLFNFLYYINQYFVQQNYYTSQEWQYGYKEAIEEVKKVDHKYEKIIVSNKPHLDQSYIFFLFYLKYPPGDYQKESLNVSGGFREDHYFGKYEFRSIEWDKEKKSSDILYIGRPADFPPGANILRTILFLNNEPAIYIVKGQ